MRIIKPLLAVLATGFILVYFSEFLFWARPRAGDNQGGWLGSWLVYSFTGFILVSVIGYFRARSIWALFLAGAVFGWLTEGLVVQTAYENLPLSLSFTGLAWHALISVLLGWWVMRKCIKRGLLSTLCLSAAIGLGYGLWAVHWWLAPDGGVSSVSEFSFYSLTATLLVLVAYGVVDRWLPEPFIPKRWIVLFAAILLAAFFIFVTVPATPLAAVILPILLLIIFATLRHNRAIENEGWAESSAPAPLVNYLGLLALPVVAIAFYALAAGLELRWQTNWMFYLITTPAGFILFFLSLWKIWHRQPSFSP